MVTIALCGSCCLLPLPCYVYSFHPCVQHVASPLDIQCVLIISVFCCPLSLSYHSCVLLATCFHYYVPVVFPNVYPWLHLI